MINQSDYITLENRIGNEFSPLAIEMRLGKYPELKMVDVTVYTYLTSFPTVKNKGFSHPPIKTIAMRCRISVKTVLKSIERLMRVGLVVKIYDFYRNHRPRSSEFLFPVTDSEIEKAKETNLWLLSEKKKLEYTLFKEEIIITEK